MMCMPVRAAHAPSELENFVHFSVVEDLMRAEHVDSGNSHIFFYLSCRRICRMRKLQIVTPGPVKSTFKLRGTIEEGGVKLTRPSACDPAEGYG